MAASLGVKVENGRAKMLVKTDAMGQFDDTTIRNYFRDVGTFIKSGE
jgi:hypothetical protein